MREYTLTLTPDFVYIQLYNIILKNVTTNNIYTVGTYDHYHIQSCFNNMKKKILKCIQEKDIETFQKIFPQDDIIETCNNPCNYIMYIEPCAIHMSHGQNYDKETIFIQ